MKGVSDWFIFLTQYLAKDLILWQALIITKLIYIVVRCTVKLCTTSGNLFLFFVFAYSAFKKLQQFRLMITDALASNIE